MRRLAYCLFLLLLALPAWAAPKVLRTYTFAGRTYHQISQADGTRIEIAGPVGTTAVEAIAKIPPKAVESMPEQARVLAKYGDEELVTELTRRKVLVEGAGTLGLQKAQEVKK